MQLVKRIVVIAIIVLVIAVPINDLVRFLGTYYSLDNITREAAQEAALVAAKTPTDRNGPGVVAVRYAQDRGAVVFGYEQVGTQVTVWAKMPVPGTLGWGPILAATAGRPFKVWWTTPPVIESKAQAFAM